MIMPQLDVSTFPSQIFWLFLAFAVLYFSVHFVILPSIRKCILMRESLIASINEKIKDYESQVQLQQMKYEKGISNAKSIARDMIKDMDIWMKKYKDEQDALLHQKIKDMFEETSKKISLFKESVMDEFENLAFDIAVTYNLKVIGKVFAEDHAMLLKLRAAVCDIIKKGNYL